MSLPLDTRPHFRPFQIIVKIDGVNRRPVCIQTLHGLGEDHFEVKARNKTLKFSTNKPIIDRRDLKDFPWTWKLIEGELHNQRAREIYVEVQSLAVDCMRLNNISSLNCLPILLRKWGS